MPVEDAEGCCKLLVATEAWRDGGVASGHVTSITTPTSVKVKCLFVSVSLCSVEINLPPEIRSS